VKRIIGGILYSEWDFFETEYYGGNITEGCMRSAGTLFGSYIGGLKGEQKLGWLGYLVGSHLGSWIGGMVGCMFFEV